MAVSLKDPASDAARLPPASPPGTDEPTVLIVDDRDAQRLAAVTALAGRGYQLIEAASGEDALRWLLKREVALVLLDVNMPGMNGFETAELIRARPTTAHTPIIFLTGADEHALKAFRGYSAGAVDYIPLPIHPDILRAKVAVFVDLYRMHVAVQRQARQLEDANRELRAANEELEAFSYSVSHDLRAPLRAIAGFGEMLLEECSAQLNEQGRFYVQRMSDAAKRMGELIEDLLQLSRVVRSEFRWEHLDLSAIAAQIVDELRKIEPDRQAEVAIAPGVTAQGDGRLIWVVLHNLIENAWKYTSKQPQAHIAFGVLADGGWPAGEVRIDELAQGGGGDIPSAVRDQHIFFVRDDGAGFDMTYADRLFKPFQRLHGVDEFPGTGIGLATVQRVVRRHGGKVWAESEVGKGTTVYFTLAAGPSIHERPGLAST